MSRKNNSLTNKEAKMERDYVIVADSTNDIPKSFAEENEIRILPFFYEIDGES